MSERKIKVNGLYKHFKGTYHKIICIAKDSEDKTEKVVYTHEDTGEIWIRDKKMFLSEVDHDKYPEVLQKYRFEEVEENK